jgi:tRNA-splicing endonuclease subunit Sen2
VYALFQGWLPRSGLLYGTDFTLYQMHPSVAHSTFSVVVMPLLLNRDDCSNDSSTGSNGSGACNGLGPAARSNRQLDWHDLQITARVVGTVRGGFVIEFKLCASCISFLSRTGMFAVRRPSN